MPTINKSQIVPYNPEQMYSLVNDIEHYSEFIPWCVRGEVQSSDEHEIRACLHFAKGGMEKSFTTLNRLQPYKMIEMSLVDGPFKHLDGFWRFDPLEDEGCRVSLDMSFEFATKLIAMMAGSFFQQIASSLVDAFCKRAHEVYGD
ncbi:MAG: type II toxin-antitoxin system RatA family toxin [Gammaproteobacteria bacterium]|nr:type II toxin-antitoxin system RatA family toxin [Gammaproteobacteria bacterium]MCH9744651.1 type II toxin-antitoxin system RatA family toxin [Gammaproteobacteria bacterium]